jgi:hypothetical protein
MSVNSAQYVCGLTEFSIVFRTALTIKLPSGGILRCFFLRQTMQPRTQKKQTTKVAQITHTKTYAQNPYNRHGLKF